MIHCATPSTNILLHDYKVLTFISHGLVGYVFLHKRLHQVISSLIDLLLTDLRQVCMFRKYLLISHDLHHFLSQSLELVIIEAFTTHPEVPDDISQSKTSTRLKLEHRDDQPLQVSGNRKGTFLY